MWLQRFQSGAIVFNWRYGYCCSSATEHLLMTRCYRYKFSITVATTDIGYVNDLQNTSNDLSSWKCVRLKQLEFRNVYNVSLEHLCHFGLRYYVTSVRTFVIVAVRFCCWIAFSSEQRRERMSLYLVRTRTSLQIGRVFTFLIVTSIVILMFATHQSSYQDCPVQ